MTTIKMMNGQFCYPSGSKCFADADRDNKWDGAGQKPSGRPMDVPYEVTELRKETTDQPVLECRLKETASGSATLEELTRMGGTAGQPSVRCSLAVGAAACNCGGLQVSAVEVGDAWLRYRVDRSHGPSHM